MIERLRRRPNGARPRRARDQPPPFYRSVYRIVRRIPSGKVATYGQIAAILGQPRGARAVGMALGALKPCSEDDVPWQRVINAAGRCSHRDGFMAGLQQDLLEREGVTFDGRGHVDLRRARWAGPRRAAPRRAAPGVVTKLHHCHLLTTLSQKNIRPGSTRRRLCPAPTVLEDSR